MAAPKARGDFGGCEAPKAFALLLLRMPRLHCVPPPLPRRGEVGILEKIYYHEKIIGSYLVNLGEFIRIRLGVSAMSCKNKRLQSGSSSSSSSTRPPRPKGRFRNDILVFALGAAAARTTPHANGRNWPRKQTNAVFAGRAGETCAARPLGFLFLWLMAHSNGNRYACDYPCVTSDDCQRKKRYFHARNYL